MKTYPVVTYLNSDLVSQVGSELILKATLLDAKGATEVTTYTTDAQLLTAATQGQLILGELYRSLEKPNYLYVAIANNSFQNILHPESDYGTTETPLLKWNGTKFAAVSLDDVRGYKCYMANLSQTGTDAPTAYRNDASLGTPVLARTGTGVYTLTLTGAFVGSKTVCIKLNESEIANTAGSFKIVRTSADVVTISTFSDKYSTPADAILSNTPIEIRVYN